ncbi:MAG: hypothetical protein FJW39_15735 [Acidobacteria bacterium]|nr:hypothetical protein [Acidobacteriota bacterium]
MSAVQEIRWRIQEANRLITEFEAVIASRPPGTPTPLTVNIRALEKVRVRLEAALEEAVRDEQPQFTTVD